MAARSGGSSFVQPLHPPSPKSPPKYPDLYGKRRERAKVQMLEREISFLEEELKSIEGFQPASRYCKEVTDFVMANSDPLIQLKNQKSCGFWKWLCGLPCFNMACTSCCRNSGCCCYLKCPECWKCSLCDCSSCNCMSCKCCTSSDCNACKCTSCDCSSCNCSSCFSRCKVPKWQCCCGKMSCCCKFRPPSCTNCCSCKWKCYCPKCPKLCNCFRCTKTCCNPCC